MNGRILLIVVLLTVFAIPLLTSQPLGNTVGEFSAISTINKKEESNSFTDYPGSSNRRDLYHAEVTHGGRMVSR